MPYMQLTQVQRYQIYALMKADLSQTQIANIMGVHKSTISRELSRNRGLRGYRPKQAHQFCVQRRHQKTKPRIEPSTWQLIERLLRAHRANQSLAPSGGQHVLADKQAGETLYRHLRCQKQRKKRYGPYSRRGCFPNAISIEQRPAIVDTRRRFGGWELDTMTGKNHRHALVTLVEHKSRLTLIAKVARKTAEAVAKVIIRLLKPLSPWVHSLTADNGREFSRHQKITKALGARFYFVHPFASWERGLNENTNGLIRQYFPKKHDFSTITQTQIERLMDKLNKRPQKCLGIKTLNQVFFGIKPNVALAT